MQTPEEVVEQSTTLSDSVTSSRSRQKPACEECRRRKLRCDGQQPQCGVCKETGVMCEVNPVRAPRGPKRGYLKNLRNRVSMLENRFAAQSQSLDANQTGVSPGDVLSSSLAPLSNSIHGGNADAVQDIFCMIDPAVSEAEMTLTSPLLDFGSLHDLNLIPEPPLTPSTTCMTVSSIPLCEFTQAELNQLYFDRVHPSLPILHQRRYHSWSKLHTNSTARLALQYSMWTMASLLSGQFQHLQEGFYQEARQMLEAANLANGTSGTILEIELAQAWVLLATYESMKTQHQHAWMSAGRAFRLVQLMRLHEIDSPSNPSSSASDADFVTTEEKRRVFWMAYFIDHLFSMKNNSPIRLNEHVICTRLPAQDADFQNGQSCVMDFLSDAIVDGNPNPTARSPFNECIILVTICGQTLFYNQQYNMRCLHGDSEADRSDWDTWFDSILSTRLQILSKCYPSPTTGYDPMLLFAHIIAQASVIYLCKEVKSMVWPSGKAMSLRTEYQQRALNAAEHIVKLAYALVEFSVFKVHPLMPIPIFLSIEFLFANRQLPRAAVLLRQLLDVLSQVKSVIDPKRNYVLLLDLTHILPMLNTIDHQTAGIAMSQSVSSAGSLN
ncbi:citrinin biosynthesis transcriptional activator CtnR [Metarhizium rileyi]|uniref:Citrinin biosynthesis transcriptional activator CtnR n=1 Tax=Metarhizium rileyi (strain RCEF 4871) TaxID=1649241 RepID=A0A167EBZ1_METRR|nr:citrinin biosynthesis transcriptional activator CtnR [Metarhizium rileyi RCEF 4871]